MNACVDRGLLEHCVKRVRKDEVVLLLDMMTVY